eukprot:gene4994-15240_t
MLSFMHDAATLCINHQFATGVVSNKLRKLLCALVETSETALASTTLQPVRELVTKGSKPHIPSQTVFQR